MKASARQVVIIICSLALLVSCSKTDLRGGGQQQVSADTPPPVAGPWELDYEFKGNSFIGNVTFSQTGTALDGAGADQDGRQWQLESGQIQGTKVVFGKKYTDSGSPPIIYNGELKYLKLPEYAGWAMEGTYSFAGSDRNIISGKWVANPTAPAASPAEPAAPPQQQQQ